MTSRLLLSFQAIVLSGVILSGCATRSVYLQQMTFDGPQAQPPLFMTGEQKPGDMRIVPRVSATGSQSVEGRASGHSGVNAAGVYHVDTVAGSGGTRFIEPPAVNINEYQGLSLFWKPTSVTASVDFEYTATRNLALVGGLSYSPGASRSYAGATLGFGLFFRDKRLAGRLDIGGQWHSMQYNVDYVITKFPFNLGETETPVAFVNRSGSAVLANGYVALTLNSTFDAFPFQIFTQISINRQSLVSFSDGRDFYDDARVAQTISFFIVTPGVFIDIAPGKRLVGGIRLSDETELLIGEPGVLLTPFVQVEFGL